MAHSCQICVTSNGLLSDTAKVGIRAGAASAGALSSATVRHRINHTRPRHIT